MSVLLTCRSVLTIAWKTFYLVSILNEGEYCKSSIKPPGALFISNLFDGGGGGGRAGVGLFNLANTMVSVLHKAQEYRVVKPCTKKKSDLPVGE